MDFRKNIFFILRRTYIFVNVFKNRIYLGLNFLLLYFVNLYLKNKNIYFIFTSSTSVGDVLIYTSLVKNKCPCDIIIIHQSPEIFKNLDIKNFFVKKTFFNNMLLNFLKQSPHSNIIGVLIKPPKHSRDLHIRDRAFYEKKEFSKIIKDVSKDVVVKFDRKELRELEKKYSMLENVDYGLIISENKSSGLSKVKRWGTEKMQKVVDSSRKKIKWVQTGSKGDSPLDGVFLNLAGKTNLREVFFLISRAKVIVTIEGMLTHASSAFNIPCVTIFPSFAPVEISMYDNIIPVIPSPYPECAPCGLSVCKKNKDMPPCMEAISAEDVIEKVNYVLRDK